MCESGRLAYGLSSSIGVCRSNVVTGSVEDKAMNRETLNFHNIDDHSGAGMRNRMSVSMALQEMPQAATSKHAPSRNWAWAHVSDSYDWMNSHSPAPSAELSE